MNIIPLDVIRLIIELLPITDKRQFTRTCSTYHKITQKLLQIAENNFKVKHFDRKYFGVEKFTLELCNDKYFDKIPISYFNEKNEVIMPLLALNGQLELLKFGISKSCPFNHYQEFAAINGHLEIIKWTKANGHELYMDSLMRIATRNGQLEVLKWVHIIKNEVNDKPCDESATSVFSMTESDPEICTEAARNGHIEILKWAKENGYEWDARTCSGAAFYGQFETLKWLRENSCPWNSDVCSYAALNGHFEILKWAAFGDRGTSAEARENSCPWDAKTCGCAAKKGRFEILKWLIENSCPMNSNTCAAAAFGGHFEILKWLRKNGCELDEKTCYHAHKNKHFEILNWAINNGCKCDNSILKFMKEYNHDEDGNVSNFEE